MKSPKIGKQRSAANPLSLSRALPKLKIPAAGGASSAARPRPNVGKPNPAGGVKGGRNG